MTLRHSVFSHPLLYATVCAYQRARGLKSWSAAATELLAIGIESWLQNAAPTGSHWGETPQEEVKLIEEFHLWEAETLNRNGWDQFTDLSDEQANALSFERFLLLKFSPKHGGDRKSEAVRKSKKSD